MAVFHIDHVTDLGEAVDEGSGEMVVFEEIAPFAETKIRRNERALFFMPLLHQSEKQTDLHGLDFDISYFIDMQAIVGKVFLDDLWF